VLEQLKREFLSPGSEFTPIPFWFWNDDLKEEEIKRQIHDFKEKGVDGFVIHPRIGIPEEIEYLSERFMELVRCAAAEAQKLDMKVVLYDEGMYPSGSAHGMVVKSNPKFASRGLKLIEKEERGKVEISTAVQEDEALVAALAARKTGKGSIDPDSIKVLEPADGKIFADLPDEPGWFIFQFIETFSRGHIRGIHFGEDDGEPNAPPSTDLLNPDAIQRFIELTHEKYYESLKDYFGNTIIGIFTDEPGILGRGGIQGLIPWTYGFKEWYLSCGGNIKDLLAQWYDVGSETEQKRYIYRQVVNKRMEMAYYKPISDWCREHGIALTGHPSGSDDIGMLKYFHIPGQDIVWRWVAPEDDKALAGADSTQGKCSSDAARHMGRRRNSNECFGCCGPNGIHWAFSVDDMKWYMDWLFVRGVNLLYPHAFYYSIRGKRKEERPPDVGPNNLWWSYYKYISNYIKRMSWLMTDIVNITSVAVLCEGDHLSWAIVRPLFENQIEFNYLQKEFLIKGNARAEKGLIHIEKQRYKVLVIEDSSQVNESCKGIIQDFINQGGKVIICSGAAGLTGAIPIKRPEEIVDALDLVIERDAVLSEPCKDLRVTHVVKAGMHFYLLVNEGENTIDCDMTVSVTGSAEQWDAWKGTTAPAVIKRADKEGMVIAIRLERRESLIIAVDPGQSIETESAFQLTADKEREADLPKEILTLNTGWKIVNSPIAVNMETELKSWTCFSELESFSGTLIYENRFHIDAQLSPDKSVYLDLGELHSFAVVTVNGEKTGIKMWAPFTFDITRFVKPGENSIQVEVTNTLANRYTDSKLPSGLIGPVKLYT